MILFLGAKGRAHRRATWSVAAWVASVAVGCGVDDQGDTLTVRNPRNGSAGAPMTAGAAGASNVAGASAGVAGASNVAGASAGGAPMTGGAGAGTSAGQAGAGTSGVAGGGSGGAGEGGGTAGGASGGGGVGGSPAGGSAGAGGVAACPADMVQVGDACMDRFEAPNVAGELPFTMKTAPEGEAWCQAIGKRLCTETEWNDACGGAAKLPYPYGASYEEHRCNDDKTWKVPDWTALGTYPAAAGKAEADRLDQADPSGARAMCTSDAGVFDLTGNVAEWVVRTLPNANNYEHVMKGCYWSKCFGGSNPSCGFVNPGHPGTFRTYEAGFRCCRDAM